MDSGKHAEEMERGLQLLRETLVDNQVDHERLRLEASTFYMFRILGGHNVVCILVTQSLFLS